MSFRATSAAAPPPTVLNTETSCGISVIFTFLAETTPGHGTDQDADDQHHHGDNVHEALGEEHDERHEHGH